MAGIVPDANAVDLAGRGQPGVLRESAEDIKQTWSDTGEKLKSSGKIGSIDDLLEQAERDAGGR
ncbi:hypothetical protein ABZY44_37060 [Streptomyces sp. NPDC006544]|uniref:hypothetical protein n=1 Tax=Streptomyces sp. NPDC006544 TaxID=3154583 RepID=UPI0033A6B147